MEIQTNKGDDIEITNLDYLPNEILLRIVQFLTIEGFQKLLQTCKFFAREFNDEYIWKIVAQRQALDIFYFKPTPKTYKWLCLAKIGSYTINRNSLWIYGNYTEDEDEYNSKENGYAISKRNQKVLSGYFKDGELDGEGICWWDNGNKYEGEWTDGSQCGNGKFSWNDGDYYEGEWLEDHRHGQGTYYWPKGACYKGTFDMNVLDGDGIYAWKNGYYKGKWSKSRRHGPGEIVWTNGNKFVGNFLENKKQGYGEYYWTDGSIYKGHWFHDNRDGKATTVWKNGMSYEGMYKNDLREGQGKLIWPNGDMYVGQWKRGGRFGTGTFISSDCTETKQWWKEKQKIKYSKEIPKKLP